ncbi:MATE family efflux transporter [Gudongella oleilytica]|jgi:putative MATE family efflux protein|uniref:MATE family efflux transporter n=1 Tax=Gudongella oleilytica TaxID=1582259 RepID=UPI002A36AB2D|nr:MATE family efflux transporter [Gudongella oleilytica]MDY0256419.1 MATE family efflux transporter [Gudongella oleilytica]
MNIFKDKTFMKGMLAIAVPVAIQNLISSSVNMIDTLMISSLGQASIAAVGLANQVFFLYILITFGINSGSSIFIAQFWGKEDIPSIKKVMGLAITLSTIAGTIFTAAAFFFPTQIMSVLIKEPEVIKLGAEYLRIVSLSYTITAVSFAFSISLRTTGRPNVPLKVSIISFLTNTVLNYIFIFGHLGLEPMGVKGAAIGTLIARIVEIILILYAIYGTKSILAASVKELMSWHKDFLKKYIETTYPVVITEGFWALGQVLYAMAYARIGEEATAAVQLTNTIQNLFFVVVRGLANACNIMVGAKIGGGDEKVAYDYAIRFIFLSTISGLALGIIMALTPDIVLKLFRGLDPNLYETSRALLIVLGITFVIRVYNTIAIVGVLRAGGDTKIAMRIDLGTVWLIGVPLAFIGALVLKLPIHQLVLLVTLEEVVKALVGIPIIKSGKWIKNLT